MKQLYCKPTINVLKFEDENIITSSNLQNQVGSGQNSTGWIPHDDFGAGEELFPLN